MIAKEFANAIFVARSKKSMTQRQLAQAIGVDHTYISKIECCTATHSPSPEIIDRLAVVLGLDNRELQLMAGRLPEKWEQAIAVELARKIREGGLPCRLDITIDE